MTDGGADVANAENARTTVTIRPAGARVARGHHEAVQDGGAVGARGRDQVEAVLGELQGTVVAGQITIEHAVGRAKGRAVVRSGFTPGKRTVDRDSVLESERRTAVAGGRGQVLTVSNEDVIARGGHRESVLKSVRTLKSVGPAAAVIQAGGELGVHKDRVGGGQRCEAENDQKQRETWQDV